MDAEKFKAKTIAFFDTKPFLFHVNNVLLTQWFPINDPLNVDKLRKIDGLNVDSRRMLVRRYRVI
jgi:hypothetical protein